ncbi:hypothetical protein BDV23DRAFT_176941 [Aspergillus alliaceus]|uniref:FAD-binding domain-containing protein n=1 Tax=Petromyces alliaceus TaxID=209559 RepID=A0A5N7BRY8_PETAA|nr:hypothetical protein BDV23DRAFT_176941 [Aspergillus alliaceus]
MENQDWEMTDVVICGCGPTEVMLLNYLSQMSISNVILEREADISTDPAQPKLEKSLRKRTSNTTFCDWKTKSTVFELREDGNWTYSKYHDAQGMERKIRARFPVGADGKTGFTRKIISGRKAYIWRRLLSTCLSHITLPTPESHPQFPLWKLGYTLEQVYDIFFPDEFRFLCEPPPPSRRVVLCGDAAHVFPPFGGQGSAFGFRDAVSLTWRPALLCRVSSNHAQNPRTISVRVVPERKQQLEKSLAVTILNDKFLKGSLKLPQVFCKDMSGKVSFTEDVIFRSEQNSLFRLFVYLRNDEELEPARNAMRVTQEISRGEFGVDNISFIVEQITCDEASDYKNLFQIASAEDFAQSPLCNGRPKPTYYEPFLVRKEVCAEYIIVRPDRFVFAACDGDQSLKVATNCMLDILYSSLESTTA